MISSNISGQNLKVQKRTILMFATLNEFEMHKFFYKLILSFKLK